MVEISHVTSMLDKSVLRANYRYFLGEIRFERFGVFSRYVHPHIIRNLKGVNFSIDVIQSGRITIFSIEYEKLFQVGSGFDISQLSY